jgi:hypothetical protein
MIVTVTRRRDKPPRPAGPGPAGGPASAAAAASERLRLVDAARQGTRRRSLSGGIMISCSESHVSPLASMYLSLSGAQRLLESHVPTGSLAAPPRRAWDPSHWPGTLPGTRSEAGIRVTVMVTSRPARLKLPVRRRRRQ